MMIDIFNHFMPKAYLDRLGTLIPGHVVLTAFPRLKTLWDVDARLAPRRVRRAAASALARQSSARAHCLARPDARACAHRERRAGGALPHARRSLSGLRRGAAAEQYRRPARRDRPRRE